MVHLSSRDGLTEVLRANRRGVPLRAETCPQYLLLDASRYGTATGDDLDEVSGYVISPPLREVADQDVLWQAVSDGSVQFIGTDHCAFNVHGQKDAGGDDFRSIPNGAPGIQLRMELLYTYGVEPGRISLERYVELNATNAARYFGVHPRKGILAPGSDADVVMTRTSTTRRTRVGGSPDASAMSSSGARPPCSTVSWWEINRGSSSPAAPAVGRSDERHRPS